MKYNLVLLLIIFAFKTHVFGQRSISPLNKTTNSVNPEFIQIASKRIIQPDTIFEKLTEQNRFLYSSDSLGIVLFKNTNPKSESDVAGILNSISHVEVIGTKSNWNKILINKDTFYVDVRPVSIIKFELQGDSFNTFQMPYLSMTRFNQFFIKLQETNNNTLGDYENCNFCETGSRNCRILVVDKTSNFFRIKYLSTPIKEPEAAESCDGGFDKFYFDKNKQSYFYHRTRYTRQLKIYWDANNMFFSETYPDDKCANHTEHEYCLSVFFYDSKNKISKSRTYISNSPYPKY